MSDAARWKATVFVGGLSQVVTSNHLLDAFIPFGEIVEVQLPKADARKSADPHRGFAYVEFEDPEDAKEAIDNMDQSEFFGKILKVSQAKAPKSADEGLSSKKAVWEQVRICRFKNHGVHADDLNVGRLVGRLCSGGSGSDIGSRRCSSKRRSTRSHAGSRGVGCGWAQAGMSWFGSLGILLLYNWTLQLRSDGVLESNDIIVRAPFKTAATK